MLKTSLLIALITFSALFAHADDRPDGAPNDADQQQSQPRQDIAQPDREPAQEQVQQPQDAPAPHGHMPQQPQENDQQPATSSQ
jgi:hypothetical protein